ncbi:MAG: NAD(P)/FAD-dependent oxidoreductase [Cytophagales bacterium]
MAIQMVTPNIPKSSFKRIVIVGGGFAGITLAKKLVNQPFQIVLIDQNNYHQFQPLLYQVATGGLEPGAVAFPLRKIFPKKKNVHIRLAKVLGVNPESKQLETSIGTLDFDYLVIATGAGNNFFGNSNIERFSWGMKSVNQALDIRSTILLNYEKALLINDFKERDSYMNIVVVGGGPTGVELAGAISEMKRFVLPKDFPELNFSEMDIILVESNDKLLGGMSADSSKKAAEYLKKMGVDVRLNTRVTDYDGNVVTLSNGELIDSKTVLWGAGIKGNLIDGFSQEQVGRGGRILCNSFNQVNGFEYIFAIGDVALIQDEYNPNGHPQLAPVAMQQAEHLAKNLLGKLNNKPMKPFKYFDKGTMATVGRNRAVVDAPFLHFGGYLAWLTWMFIHLMSLVGFRNKLSVFVNWCYNYFKYEKAIRLITRPESIKDK